MVPVINEEEDDDDDEVMKVEVLQVGMRNLMRERRSLHDLTCLWHSTVATPLLIVLVLGYFMLFGASSLNAFGVLYIDFGTNNFSL